MKLEAVKSLLITNAKGNYKRKLEDKQGQADFRKKRLKVLCNSLCTELQNKAKQLCTPTRTSRNKTWWMTTLLCVRPDKRSTCVFRCAAFSRSLYKLMMFTTKALGLKNYWINLDSTFDFYC